MPTWNVAIMSLEKEDPTAQLGGLDVAPLIRSQLKEPSDYADIKALMSKHDVLIDVEDSHPSPTAGWDELKRRRPAVPLLLVYPIDKKSNPAKAGGQRIPLDAAGNLIGLGFVFPGQSDRSGRYFSVELNVPTPDQLEDESETAMTEADV
jgi:hypothetical protein